MWKYKYERNCDSVDEGQEWSESPKHVRNIPISTTNRDVKLRFHYAQNDWDNEIDEDEKYQKNFPTCSPGLIKKPSYRSDKSGMLKNNRKRSF